MQCLHAGSRQTAGGAPLGSRQLSIQGKASGRLQFGGQPVSRASLPTDVGKHVGNEAAKEKDLDSSTELMYSFSLGSTFYSIDFSCIFNGQATESGTGLWTECFCSPKFIC